VKGPLQKQATDQNEFKILITTDNHLGFREKDKIVGNDSFYSFDEALTM
jgi:DNA repair exonuclease SbcCD nuclease subunit